jgi:hypothetical protein
MLRPIYMLHVVLILLSANKQKGAIQYSLFSQSQHTKTITYLKQEEKSVLYLVMHKFTRSNTQNLKCLTHNNLMLNSHQQVTSSESLCLTKAD